MLLVFWEEKSVIYEKYLLPGVTFTTDRYIDTLMRLQKPLGKNGLACRKKLFCSAFDFVFIGIFPL